MRISWSGGLLGLTWLSLAGAAGAMPPSNGVITLPEHYAESLSSGPQIVGQVSTPRGIIVVPPTSAPTTKGSLVVYDRVNFRGANITVNRDIPLLNTVGFNDRTASLYVVSGTWQLCSDAGYSGRCILVSPGSYATIQSLGMAANELSSIRLTTTGIPVYPVVPQPSVPDASGNDGCPPNYYRVRNACVLENSPAYFLDRSQQNK
ncbi:MAG: hypothetical protein OHK0012_18930 [Synechococcales cyanobacterium]